MLAASEKSRQQAARHDSSAASVQCIVQAPLLVGVWPQCKSLQQQASMTPPSNEQASLCTQSIQFSYMAQFSVHLMHVGFAVKPVTVLRC